MSDSFTDPWTGALSMGFPRQECWNGLPFPSPGDLPNPGIKPASLELEGRFFIPEPPGKANKALKKKEILPYVTAWMNLEDIMESDINQTHKDKRSMVPLM